MKKTDKDTERQKPESSPEAEAPELTQEEIAERIKANEATMRSLEQSLPWDWKGDLQSLEDHYQEEAKPFIEAEEADDARAREIRASFDPEQEAAQRRVWPAQIDDLLAAGRKEEAEAKRATLKNLEDAIAARSQELEEIAARRPALLARKQVAARNVFERAAFQGVRQIREAISLACDCIEVRRQALSVFADAHGLGISLLALAQRTSVGHTGEDRGLRSRMIRLLG
jgi:hypothetical protein